MVRSMGTWLLALLLLATPAAPALAQAQTRAYAPENLRTLTVAEQSRVISLEYSEQSRGRRIPDDQLRFYLDQVRLSGWPFSRIKQDIATSLAGSGGGWNPNPGTGRTIRCESIDQRERSCQTGFRNRARLSRQISSGRCVEGQSWTQEPGVVRVRNGCRGEFTETSQGWGSGGNSGYTVTCSSDDARYRSCAWDDRRGRPVVVQNLSKARCQEGVNWGHQRNQVWVNYGCRARFGVAGGGWGGGNGGWNPGGYGVTCSSSAVTHRLAWCGWDRNRGYPRVQQELSQGICVETRSWGYDAGKQQIWTRNGCSARFVPR